MIDIVEAVNTLLRFIAICSAGTVLTGVVYFGWCSWQRSSKRYPDDAETIV